MAKFDDLLTHLGTGRWNLLYACAMGYWSMQIPYHSMGAAFLTPHMDFACHHNSHVDSPTNRSQCTYNVTTPAGEDEEQVCTEFDFDNTTYTNTITSEFGLVCEYSFLRATFKSVYFMGALVGSLLNGWISDRYGRKTMHIAGTLSFIVLGNAISWLPNISAILVVRFLMGVGHTSSLETGYTLVMETCEPRLRPVIGIITFLPWCLSLITLGGYGYLLRDWRWLMFTVSLPGVLYLPVLWLMGESPRWLIVRGRHADALRELRKASRWNKVALPSDEQLRAVMAEIQTEANETQRQQAGWPRGLIPALRNLAREVSVLLRTRRMRSITLSLYADFLLVDTVYYGLSLGGDRFNVDPFSYMALGGLMETPANTLTIPLVKLLGRRTSSTMFFVFSAVLLLTLGVTPSDVGWLVTTMILLGKLSTTAAYMVVYFHANELFPTEVRQRGMSTCTMVAKIGSMIVPFLVDILGSLGSWVPLVAFGGASLVAAAISSRLPETRGVPMKDTIAEIEAYDFRRPRRVTHLEDEGFLALQGRSPQSPGPQSDKGKQFSP